VRLWGCPCLPCAVLSHCDMLRFLHAVPRSAAPCHTVIPTPPCCATLCHAVPCCAALCHAVMLWPTPPCCATLCCTRRAGKLCHTAMMRHAVPHRVMQWSAEPDPHTLRYAVGGNSTHSPWSGMPPRPPRPTHQAARLLRCPGSVGSVHTYRACWQCCGPYAPCLSSRRVQCTAVEL
jgi:hypothetical protein